MGASGSGKTTLLKDLIPVISKVGTTEGIVEYDGIPVSDIKPGIIGYISQNPDNQIVCDMVWHELAFGLESLGIKSDIIRNRVAEISSYLGIESWFRKKTNELSGGQKQKLALASVLCMGCRWIVMDEPTSMLDPIAAREFLELIVRLRDEMGVNFIIAEHNSEYIYDKADQKIFLSHGKMTDIFDKDYLPTYLKISNFLFGSDLSISQMRSMKDCLKVKPIRRNSDIVFTLKNIRHTYDKDIVLNVLKLDITTGINCWIGPNGSGKSTLAKEITGFFGKKLIDDSIMMPQDVLMIFTKDTVRQELDIEADIPDYMADILEDLMDKNPLDISGGEQHMVAVCKILLKEASLYILDEPTKGIDITMKKKIVDVIKRCNKPVIMITHDMELVSEIADSILFLFRGEVASMGEPHDVLCSNTLYKPLISRIADDALVLEEVACSTS